MHIKYTAEELLLDESFVEYCRDENSVHKEKWKQIIEQYPAQQKVMEDAKELLFLLSPELPQEEIEREVSKLREMVYSAMKDEQVMPVGSKVADAALNIKPRRLQRGRKINKLLMYGMVSTILLCATLYVINSHTKNEPGENKSLANTLYLNTMGQRKRVVLPDSSIVILNSNSSISITSAYNREDRVVQLSGEAFFKVAKNPAKPFIVMNKKFSTTALGTSFYVHARSDENNYSVNLLEGKVKLTPVAIPGKIAYLVPAEEAEWEQGSLTFAKKNFDTTSLKQWLTGKISFNHTPLPQAIKQLEEWYAVNIEMQRKDWENLSLTGDYSNVSLDDVLKVICFSLSCEYRYSGNKVIIQ